jgi:glycosyltransferase involved in cell wall biosynthesis
MGHQFLADAYPGIPPVIRLTIGIPTYLRPESLAKLLESLAAQEHVADLSIHVVDNDPNGSAAELVDRYRARLPITYSVEPRPGVVHVRNTLIDAAADAVALIFVDDDEVVCDGWLSAMVDMHTSHPDDVITGPVLYRFTEQRPSHPVIDMVFDRPGHDDGAELVVTGTGNTLLPLSALRHIELPAFDAAFAESGGEDTDLFRRLTRSGVVIRWCTAATVQEWVEPARATVPEALKRAQRAGFVGGRVQLAEGSAWWIVAGGLLRVAWGAVIEVALGVARPRRRARGLVRVAAGIGRIQAGLGIPFRYYGAPL